MSRPNASVPSGLPATRPASQNGRLEPLAQRLLPRAVSIGPRQRHGAERSTASDRRRDAATVARRPQAARSDGARRPRCRAALRGPRVEHRGAAASPSTLTMTTKHSDDEDGGLHHRVVAREDRVDELLADAVVGEEHLDDDRAGDQVRHLDDEHRGDGRERVRQGVAPQHAARRRALGRRRAQVVLVRALLELGGDHARGPRDGERGERERRQHERRGRAAAEGREPAQPHGEDVDQQHAEDERRDGLRERHRRRRPRARVSATAAGEQDAARGCRSTTAVTIVVTIRSSVAGSAASTAASAGSPREDRVTEVEPDDVAEERQVLHEQRLVEARGSSGSRRAARAWPTGRRGPRRGHR